ncbi:MAG: hypothetical protein IJV83_01030 [Clostridia bacterium]|nr:hypothetical protein [Clostridia bacterium]
MKNWKKTAALIMALGMTTLGLAACELGGNDSSSSGRNSIPEYSFPESIDPEWSMPEWSTPEDSDNVESSANGGEESVGGGEIGGGDKEESSGSEKPSTSSSEEIGGDDKEESSGSEKPSTSSSEEIGGGDKEESSSSEKPSTSSSEEIGGGDKEESSSSERPSTSEEKPSDSSSEEIGDDEGLEEWNALWEDLCAADNLIVYTTMKEDSETGEATVTIADGKYYEVVTEDGETYYGYKGEVDGKSYEWISYDGETWECEQIYKNPSDYATGAILFNSLGKMLDYSKATYDEKTGEYIVSLMETMEIHVLVKNGKVSYIEMIDPTSDSLAITYEITYGNAVVGELPELPAEEIVIGEQVNAAGWEQAIENTYAQTNFTVAISAYMEADGVTMTAELLQCVENNKYYEYDKQARYQGNMGQVSESHYYYGEVDGKYYEWFGYGGDYWECQQTEEQEYTFETVVGDFSYFEFEAAKFDAKLGAYIFAEDGVTTEFKIVGGLVYSITMSDGTAEESVTFTFGETVVNLPPVTENGEYPGNDDNEKPVEPMGEITEDEWYEILENTYAQTHFTVEAEQTLVAEGMKGEVRANVCISEGKAYYSAIQSANGEKMKIESYLGRGEDGVMYLWYDEDGTGFEVEEAHLTEEYTTGYGIFGYYLDVLNFASVVENNNGVLVFETDEWMMTITVENWLITVISVDNYDPYNEYDSNLESFYICYNNVWDIVLPGLNGDYDPDTPVFPDTPTYPITPDVDFSGVDEKLGVYIVGEVVSEAEFKKAIENTYASTNFTVTEYADYGDMVVKAIGDYADAKSFMIAQMNGVEEDGALICYGYQYNYMGRVDGIDYMWSSVDNTNFECQVKPDYIPDYTSGKYFAQFFDILDYTQCVYNKAASAYVMTAPDGEMVAVKIVDGYVAAYAYGNSYEEENGELVFNEEIFVFTYGDASVGELPKVNINQNDPIGEITEEQWYEILENTYAQTNFTVNVEQYVVEDGQELYIGGFAEIAGGRAVCKSWGDEGNFIAFFGRNEEGTMCLWASESGAEYEVEETSLTEEYATGYGIFGYYLEALDFAYIQKNNNGYLQFCTDAWMMEVSIQDGLIVSIYVNGYDPDGAYDGQNEEHFIIFYGEASSITLPYEQNNVGGEIVGGDEVIIDKNEMITMS